MNFDDVPIIWDDKYPPPEGKQIEFEKLVRENCNKELVDLGCLDDLIFHHVFFKGVHGPFIFVCSKDGETLECHYDANPTWVAKRPTDG